jgi:hypothetical protein
MVIKTTVIIFNRRINHPDILIPFKKGRRVSVASCHCDAVSILGRIPFRPSAIPGVRVQNFEP